MTDFAAQATPHAKLIAELMNPNNPKNEREHAAVREIKRLRLGDGTSPDHLLLLEAEDALEKPVECMCGICKLTQRKPLKDEEIESLLVNWPEYGIDFFDFARAIEAAHGIKE